VALVAGRQDELRSQPKETGPVTDQRRCATG